MGARKVASAVAVGSAALGLTSCINFNPPETFSAGATATEYAFGVVAADLTGDGTADALVETTAGLVRVDICGEGCFERRENLPGARVQAVGDFDGDGIADVHTGDRLYFGGPGSEVRPAGLTLEDSVALPPFATQVTDVGDLDGDGDLDLLSTRPTAGGLYLMYVAVLGDGDGGFTQGPDITLSTALNEGPIRAEVGDVDGDGCDDVFTYRYGSVAVDPCNGLGFTASSAGGPSPWSFALGDIDGDGRDDIAMVSGATIGFLRSTGSSYVPFPPYQAITLPHPQSTVLGLRDIDGDGVVDFMMEDGVTPARWFTGTNDGGFPIGALFSPPQATIIGDDAFGDVNGDGLPDVLLPNGSPWASVILYRNTSFT